MQINLSRWGKIFSTALLFFSLSSCGDGGGSAKTSTGNDGKTPDPPLATMAYIANNGAFNVAVGLCTIQPNGSFANCKNSEAPTADLDGLSTTAVNGKTAYIGFVNRNKLSQCTIEDNGLFSGCKDSGVVLAGSNSIYKVLAHGNFLYAVSAGNALGLNSIVFKCAIAAGGVLSNCTNSGATGLYHPYGLIFNGSVAYITNNNNAKGGFITRCTVNVDGTMSACTNKGSALLSQVEGVTMKGSRLYVTNPATKKIIQCDIAADGSINCTDSSAILPISPGKIVVNGSIVYINEYGGNTVFQCTIEGNGSLSNCKDAQVTTIDGGTIDIAIK